MIEPGVRRSLRALREGERTAEEGVRQAIHRLQEAEDRVHLLAAERFGEALEEAASQDRARKAGESLGTLAGLPVVVTESIAVAGMPNSSGLAARAGVIATEDAASVARLRAAGAIVLAVVNGSESGFGLRTNNLVYGETVHPRRNDRIAGGNAGGAAAAVALGAVPAALTTDVWGEARYAAHACGLVTLRPSGGRLSVQGMFPPPVRRVRQLATPAMLVAEPMDLGPLLEVVMEDPAQGAASLLPPWQNVEDVELTWRRVLVCEDPHIFGARVQSAMRKTVRRAGVALSRCGAEPETWRPADFSRVHEIWLAMMHEAHGLQHSFRDSLGIPPRDGGAMEWMRLAVGLERVTRQTLLLLALDGLTRSSYVRIQRLCALGRRLRARIESMLSDGGVLVLPAAPGPALQRRQGWRRGTDLLHTGLWNVLDLPVALVPFGRTRQGLPLGVQVVAAHGQEAVALAFARALWRDRALR